MLPVTVEQIVGWSQGQLIHGDEKREMTGVSTDSRRLKRSECFVALKGERFDGHDFVESAVQSGASAVVIEKEYVNTCQEQLSSTVALIAVPDTTRALSDIARGYRSMFDIPIVAVTGSNGKTSTKDMIAAVLGQVWAVLATEKNFNNQIGLPLTLLGLEPRHGVAVVELGMSNLGEIASLAQTAQPTIGVVTNVGPVHLENLGTIERVADAKAELVEALPNDGLAVLNGDDERVRAMAQRTKADVITFGFSEGVDARAMSVESNGLMGSRFVLQYKGRQTPIRLEAPGRHLVQNACAAAVVAHSLGIDERVVAEALTTFRMGEMRLDVSRLKEGITLVNDAYNASPLSVRAALEVLAETESKRRVAVLGDMLELGSLTESAHRQIGADAALRGVNVLVAVGDQRGFIASGAREAGLDPGCITEVRDANEAAQVLVQTVQPHDLILLKGSRGVGLERVASAMIALYQVADSDDDKKETREP